MRGPGSSSPAGPGKPSAMLEAKSLDGQGWRTDGLRLGENDGVVGLGGMSLESFREANPASALASFSQFEILAATSPGGDCLQVQVDDADFHDLTSHTEPVILRPPPAPSALVPEPSSKSLGGGAADPPDPPAPLTPVQRSKKRRKATPPVPPWKPWPADSPLDLLELTNSAPLAAGPHRISIRSSCGSSARLLGMELYSGSKGILYDTDGVNGARLADLEKPLPALRKALLQQSHPALIIVSYGTNDIGTKGFTCQRITRRAPFRFSASSRRMPATLPSWSPVPRTAVAREEAAGPSFRRRKQLFNLPCGGRRCARAAPTGISRPPWGDPAR